MRWLPHAFLIPCCLLILVFYSKSFRPSIQKMGMVISNDGWVYSGGRSVWGRSCLCPANHGFLPRFCSSSLPLAHRLLLILLLLIYINKLYFIFQFTSVIFIVCTINFSLFWKRQLRGYLITVTSKWRKTKFSQTRIWEG